jgi:hypothetical protein
MTKKRVGVGSVVQVEITTFKPASFETVTTIVAARVAEVHDDGYLVRTLKDNRPWKVAFNQVK